MHAVRHTLRPRRQPLSRITSSHAPTPLCPSTPPSIPAAPPAGPKESAALAADVVAAGGTYVEAPVLGSQPEAEKGTLLVMVGAEADPRAVAQETVRLALGPEGRGRKVAMWLVGYVS